MFDVKVHRPLGVSLLLYFVFTSLAARVLTFIFGPMIAPHGKAAEEAICYFFLDEMKQSPSSRRNYSTRSWFSYAVTPTQKKLRGDDLDAFIAEYIINKLLVNVTVRLKKRE